MVRKVFYLFQRYLHQHGQIQKKGFPILDSRGNFLGHIDRIMVHQNRLRVEGWVLAGLVGLANRDQAVESAPSLMRDDVLKKIGDARGKTPGFVLNIPLSLDHTVFWAEVDGVRYVHTLPPITLRNFRAMRHAQIVPFLCDAARALPAGVNWLRNRDPISAARIKTALGLNTVPRSGQLNSLLFASDVTAADNPPAALASTGITIVIPVYNAFHLLPEVLARVINNTDLPWRLIVVEDCSTDVSVRPWLRKWHASQPPETGARITILENPKNLGFIRSVNRAFSAAVLFGDHVVLLNSDAFVPVRWASRLIRPLLDHDNVATVTPMSNDAEIFNIPTISKIQKLLPGEADAIDEVAAQFYPSADLADAPTGVGFCMAMHIEFLRRLPKFDTIFGHGYGEEVDWCQQVRQIGGRHLGHGGLFVEHRGGTSFGTAEKIKLIEQNNRVIARRYPCYDANVQEFIRQDPLNTPRLALAMAWAGKRQKTAVPVYLAHDLGGGAENYLQNRLKADLIADATAVVLRVGGMSRWQLELHTVHGVTRGETDSIAFIGRLLNLLPSRRIIYSCGVGDRDPISLPEILISFAQSQGDRIEILMHDFFPLSPSYTLLNSDGAYHGLPMPGLNADPAHSTFRADGTRVDLSDWRLAWGVLFQAAHRVTVFSDSSRALVVQAYPQVETKLIVSPHMPTMKAIHLRPCESPHDTPVIGVLGNIGYQKGAAILRELSQLLAKTGRGRLVILGNVDPAYRMASSAKIHGGYQIEDIPCLVARYGIDRWLIPSIWPETFSYTTHEALATGLPVFGLDIGAHGEVIRTAAAKTGQGGIIPMTGGTVDLEEALDILVGKITPKQKAVRGQVGTLAHLVHIQER